MLSPNPAASISNRRTETCGLQSATALSDNVQYLRTFLWNSLQNNLVSLESA